MTKINNFHDSRKLLNTFLPRNSKAGSYSLELMQDLMAKLGNPQDSYKVIHVAGTSGKTSTCYYIAALLRQAGKKVGLTVSPHIDEVNERVQLDLTPLPEKVFCQNLAEFTDIVQATELEPTYFELLIAFAYWYFAKAGVDYAVIEVGLGGLLDGTNVINRPDKICVITDIGLDHTNVLGDNLSAIAYQKSGIVGSHNPVFTHRQNISIMEEIHKRCAAEHAMLYELGAPGPTEITRALPPFQQRNWHLAAEVFSFIGKRDGVPALNKRQVTEAVYTKIPARLETINYLGKTLIIDGSHNGQKMAAAVEGVRALYPRESVAALVSFVESKHERAEGALQQILPITDSLIVTSFSGSQDTPKHSVDPKKIATRSKQAGFKDVTVIENPEKAFEELVKKPNEILLVTGSFYLLNHIRPLIFKRQ